jgi:hypothetical protein
MGPWSIDLSTTRPPGPARGPTRGPAGVPDWEVLVAQPLPTTPATVAALALGLAAPTGMAAAVLGLAAAQRADVRFLDAWPAVAVLAVLAVVAHGTAALAALASRRHGHQRRALMRHASLVLSRWSSPEWFQRRLEGVARGADRIAARGGARARATAATALVVLTCGLVAAGAAHPLALVGPLPVVALAAIAHNEAGEARRQIGAGARVHLRSSHVASHVLTRAAAFLAAHTFAFLLLGATSGGPAAGPGW